MAVQSVRELPRTFEQEVAKPAFLTRRFVCTLADNTLSNTPSTLNEIITAAFASQNLNLFGSAHPDPNASSFKLRRIRCEEGFEGSPYQVLVTGEYSIVRDEEILSPTERPNQWSFETQSIEVPALFYYAGSGNATRYPLTNSAYDYFPGLMTKEFIVKAKVVQNFASLPAGQIGATNSVNNDTYLGGAAHTWTCGGVASAYFYEEFGGEIVKYWQTQSELLFRATTWNLLLPDVGFNFISGNQKRRAMVFDFQNSEWVASPNPVGLNGSGAQTGGAPAILERRVMPEADFTTLFGTPPA